ARPALITRMMKIVPARRLVSAFSWAWLNKARSRAIGPPCFGIAASASTTATPMPSLGWDDGPKYQRSVKNWLDAHLDPGRSHPEMAKGGSASPGKSTGREKLELFRSRLSAKHGISVREAAEPADDIGMILGILLVAGSAGLAEQFDTA